MPMSTRLKSGLIVSAGIVMLLGLGACSPLTLLNAVTPASSYEKSADIGYGDDPRQRLDVYTPVKAGSPAPVVVFFYGGSWNNGKRSDYAFVGSALASRGIVTVIADYRLYPQVRYPAFVEDSAAAVAWTMRQISRFGADAQHVFVMGLTILPLAAIMTRQIGPDSKPVDAKAITKHAIALLVQGVGVTAAD